MKEEVVYLCEDSIDGIFTGIYEAWRSKEGPENTKVEVEQEKTYSLFSTYCKVETDMEKANKVHESIGKKLGGRCYEQIYRAGIARDPERAQSIYEFLVAGFSQGQSIMEEYTKPFVSHVIDLAERVRKEQQHYLGFLRFARRKNGFLGAVFRPKSDCLALLMPHFADRLPREKLLIFDVTHKKTAIYVPSMGWAITTTPEKEEEFFLEQGSGEEFWQQLYTGFVNAIEIVPKRNPRCQDTMMPKYFREFMFEARRI